MYLSNRVHGDLLPVGGDEAARRPPIKCRLLQRNHLLMIRSNDESHLPFLFHSAHGFN